MVTAHGIDRSPDFAALPGPGQRLDGVGSAAVALAAAMPIVWLTWRRGGVEAADQAMAFGWLVLVTVVCAVIPRRGLAVSVPWLAVAIALLPFVQVIPAGSQSIAFFKALNPALRKSLDALSLPAPSTISLYPFATVKAAVVIVGCCALYCLVRSAARARSHAAVLLLAFLAALGFVEATLGAQQYLHAQYFSLDAAAGATTFAHGTMVNRNHFAALLEGCFGASIGLLFASYGFRRRHTAPLEKRDSVLAVAAGLCLIACIVGVVLSFSRMGILVLLLAAAFALVGAAPRGKRNGRLLLVLLCIVPVVISIAIGIDRLPDRFRELILERGDPSRRALWRDTIRSAEEHLWTGAGLGSFPFAFRRSGMYLPRKTIDHAHSDYLEMLVELGVPGTLLLAGGMASCWLVSLRRLRRVQDTRRRGLAAGCLLGAGAILLHATADFPLQIPALATLVTTLLGCASGLTHQPRRETLSRSRAAVGLALALAGGSVLPAALNALHLNTEESLANGRKAFLMGNFAAASTALRDALAGNAYAAPVWMQLAELAAARGEVQQAVQFAQIADSLEPHSLRVSWPSTELLLRHGKRRQAVRRFAEIARSMPEMRPAIYHTCWAAGIQPETIAVRIVPREGGAVGEYLVFLVRRGQWLEIVPAYEKLATDPPLVVPIELMQYVLERLRGSGRESEMKMLAKLAARQDAARARGLDRVLEVGGARRTVPPG